MRYAKLLVATIAMTASFPALGNDFSNSGTRGGGSVVSVNGRPHLADLLEQTECEWTNSDEFIRDEVGQFDALIARIAQVDWYVAEKIRAEVPTLTICKSDRRLRTVPVEETDGLTIYQPARNLQQVAIRVNKDVYIDLRTFRRMSEDEKAVLILHEAMHSFIGTQEPNRNNLLMNIVRYLSRLSPSTSPENFTLNMRMNKVNLCTTCAEQLAPIKDQFIRMIDPRDAASQWATVLELIPESHRLPEEELSRAVLLLGAYETSLGGHLSGGFHDMSLHKIFAETYIYPMDSIKRLLTHIAFQPNPTGRSAELSEKLQFCGLLAALWWGSNEEAIRFLGTLRFSPFERNLHYNDISSCLGRVDSVVPGIDYSLYGFLSAKKRNLIPIVCARPDANFPQSPCNR